MKINKMFFCAAAMVIAVACAKENDNVSAVDIDYKVSFTAYAEDADTKVVMGQNEESAPQTFWEDGDAISVYSSNDTESGSSSKTGFKFITSLANSSSTAVFGYDGEDFIPGDYCSIYPHRDNARAVNFETYQAAQIDIPQNQTLVAGSFDRSAALAAAYTTDATSLHFKNLVSLIRFKVADADVTSGSIVAEGANLAGRFILRDFNTDDLHLDTYGTNATYNSVNFAPENDTVLSTEEEYYVAVKPGALENGFSVALNGITVKTYSSEVLSEFKRNGIYNLGTLTIPKNSNELVLVFDFTDAEAMAGFPQTGTLSVEDYKNEMVACKYTLSGADYTFYSACGEGASNGCPYYNADDQALASGQYRYLGLPIVEGMALTKVEFTTEYVKTTGRKIGITTTRPKSSLSVTEFVAGGEAQDLIVGYHSFDNLTSLDDQTQYWLTLTSAVRFTGMTLTYTKLNQE